MLKTNTLIDIVGWIGAAALLMAYAFVSTRKMEGDSVSYQLLNLGGSVFLMANSYFYGAYPSSMVNIVWISIAVFIMVRKKLKKQS
ncbi:MAG: CBU_0592 family membrane protein [Thermodesulfobacteriota bacterium]